LKTILYRRISDADTDSYHFGGITGGTDGWGWFWPGVWRISYEFGIGDCDSYTDHGCDGGDYDDQGEEQKVLGGYTGSGQ
jgi:hypothetical protein